MRGIILSSASVAIFATIIGAVSAQISSTDLAPAELPPNSFRGKQFVDSRGCAFLRSGLAGKVTWVPRVSQDRKPLCGFRPTFAGLTTAPETPTSNDTQSPASGVVDLAPSAADTRSARVAPTLPEPAGDAPFVILNVDPPPDAPVSQVAEVEAEPEAEELVLDAIPEIAGPDDSSTPDIVLLPSVAPQDAPEAETAAAEPSVPYNPITLARQEERKRAHAVMKAKPARKSAPAREMLPEWWPQNNSTIAADAVLKGPVGVNQRIRLASLPAPRGYQKVNRQGRLNPLRAVGTDRGKAQMQQVWSTTVPRVLLNRDTGKPLRKRKFRIFR